MGNGLLYMNSDATNLYIGFDPGADLNDNVVIFLDSRSGGFTDAQMNDVSDPGRNLSSNLTRDVDDIMPIGADFSVVIGDFGIVVFELNAGNSSGHLGFVDFVDTNPDTNSSTLFREVSIPLSTLGNPSLVDFFTIYGSDDNFISNEGIPNPNIANNPGYDNNANGGGPVTWANYDRFVVVPEPASLTLFGLGALAICRRRRRSI